MGTALAPNYVNLFVDRFETKAVEGYNLKPLVLKRFIDDILWSGHMGGFTQPFH